MDKKLILIVYNKVLKEADLDEADVLVQVKNIKKALSKEYIVKTMAFHMNMTSIIKKIEKIKPYKIFNLVESVEGKGELSYLAPICFALGKIKYTGSNSEAIYITSNKILTKEILSVNSVNTPSWISLKNTINFNSKVKYMVKPISEDASLGINQDSVVKVKKLEELLDIMKEKEKIGFSYFAEEYIHGREFNISLISQGTEIKILPPAEIIFKDFPKDKLPILDYNAKWNENSFEYKNTIRTFDFPKEDEELLRELKEVALKVWNIFSLSSYARVDMRVDKNNEIWILEVNANPCLSPDSGFVAACAKEGIFYDELILKLVESV